MTHEAACPLDRASGARGGAGSDVVDVRSALHPTTLQALSLSSTYVSLETAPDGGGGGGGAEGREWGAGGRAAAEWGGGSDRDE
jgi:hypothetical protein